MGCRPGQVLGMLALVTEMGGLYSGSFVGYRRQTELELREALISATVAVDTNVLIDLYRYRPQTAEDLLAILERLGERLVVPHQVVLEFWRKHSQSQASPVTASRTLREALVKNARSMKDALTTWAKDLGVGSAEVQALTEEAGTLVEQLKNQADAAIADDSTLRSSGDRFLLRLESLLRDKVTPLLPTNEWESCVQEGRRRVEAEEPPGYLDADKEGSDRPEGAAGDYLVWHQAIHYALGKATDLIIVTRDEKEDWWWRQRSDFLGPRPELAEEFYRITDGRRLFLLRPVDLLQLAPSALNVEVDSTSSEDASRISEEDSDATEQPWTMDALQALLSALDAEAPVQAQALRHCTNEAGGKVARELIYELGDYHNDRMLRGFTRPFGRLTEALQASGGVPRGVRPIFVARYPDGVKASYFSVPPEIPGLLTQIQDDPQDDEGPTTVD